MKKNYLIFLLKLIITVILVGLIIRQIEWPAFVAQFRNLNWFYLGIMILLWPPSLAITAYRWQFLLSAMGIRISGKLALYLYWVSSFFSNFLPTGMGGDAYKFIYLARSHPQRKMALGSSIIVERVWGGLIQCHAVLLIGAFLMATNSGLAGNGIFYLSYALASLGGVIVTVFLWYGPRAVFKNEWPMLDGLRKFINQCLSVGDHGVLIKGLVLSVIFLFMNAGSTYVTFLACGIKAGFLVLLYLVPLINLTDMIPITINSLGLKEGVAIYFFSLFGYAPETVVTVYLIGRVNLFLWTATGGIGFLFHSRTNKNSLHPC